MKAWKGVMLHCKTSLFVTPLFVFVFVFVLK